MILRCQRPFKSIKPGAVDGVNLSDFTVLTGQNGAGKSNLLEAINTSAVIFEELGQLPADKIRLFSIGQLLATAEGPVSPSSFKEPWANLFNNLQSWKQQADVSPELVGNPTAQDNWMNANIVNNKLMTQTALVRMLSESGKRLLDFTADDLRTYSPLIGGVRDPFSASIAEVFLSYAQRRFANEVFQFIKETKGRGEALTDEEFTGRFGGPPWELLDDTLSVVGLSYKFVPPPDDSDSTNYEVMLRNEDGDLIRPGDLSSGERVLLVVAVSLFTGSRMNEAIELPKVLLLDEADASLHPSMVKSLLTVIEEIFVKQYGVTVIMTTHSPSTVALAPAGSLFIMGSHGEPRLKLASVDEALGLLTIGVSSLSVSLENRRQVFVESQYDQGVYQNLYRILKAEISSDRSLEFIAVSKNDATGGCDAVKRLVKELRDAGVSSVFGLIDRDKRGGAPDYIKYLGDRYAVENLVLDPLVLGVFLLREGAVQAEELGLPAGTRHFEVKGEHAAGIVQALASRLSFAGSTVKIEYHGGFAVEVSTEFLEQQGHTLEDLVKETFPKLKGFRNLKQDLVTKAMADVPGVVPESVLELFTTLLND